VEECIAMHAECDDEERSEDVACDDEVQACYDEARSLPEDEEHALLFERCIPLREACSGSGEPPLEVGRGDEGARP
jgi:hypothetical protein